LGTIIPSAMPFGKFLEAREMVKQSDADSSAVEETRPVDLLAQLSPGVPVLLVDLSERTGMSAAEVREHLARLQELGLAQIIETEGGEAALATEQGALAL